MIDIGGLVLSPNGKAFVTGSKRRKSGDERRIKVWGLDGALVKNIQVTDFESMVIDLNGKVKIAGIVQNPDGKFSIWYRQLNGKKKIVGQEKTTINSLALSPAGSLIVTGSADGKTRLWHQSGELRKVFTGQSDDPIERLIFSPNGSMIATFSSKKRIKLWDISGKLITVFKGHPNAVQTLAFSGDNKIIAIAQDNRVSIWSVSAGLGNEFDLLDSPAALSLSYSGNRFAVGFSQGDISLFTMDGNMLKTFTGNQRSITSIAISPDGNTLFSVADNEITIRDLQTEDRVNLVSFGDEWVMYTPDGYFDASRNAGPLITMVKGLDAYVIDQFAIRRNRPDIILKRFNYHDVNQIDYYHRLYKRRLKKAGLTQTQLRQDYHTPEAKIIDFKKTDDQAELTFVLTDSRYELKSYNIYVNDVPLFNGPGKKISGSSITRTEKVELLGGENRIEVVAVNEAGIKSNHALTYAYNENVVYSDLYYIGFGVSRYKDSDLNLRYAHKDAMDLANILAMSNETLVSFRVDGVSNKFAGEIDILEIRKSFVGVLSKKEQEDFRKSQEYVKASRTKVHTMTLTDEEVTVENIIRAKQFLANAKPNDVFVLFIIERQ